MQHVTVHKPPRGALEAFGAAPCRVFWLDHWERTEALDGLAGGKAWAAVVHDPHGWYAVVSRGEVTPSEVERQIASGLKGRTSAFPPVGYRVPKRQAHVRLGHVERLGEAVRKAHARPGSPAVLVWHPILEEKMRPAERIYPRGRGSPEGEVDVEQLVQHNMDQIGPWIGTFDTIVKLAQGEWTGADWSHLFRIGQVGRGDGQFLPGGRNGVSGKGLTSTSAAVSAVCESIERRCLSLPDQSPLAVHEGTMHDLEIEGQRCVDPRDLVAFSDDQWSAPDRARHAYFRMPLEQLPRAVEHLALEWVEGTDKHTGEAVLVPRDHVFYRFRQPSLYFLGDSNGASTGSSLHDAFQRGFREVHERAMLALWWDWRLERPSIPVESLPDTDEGRWCKMAPARFAEYGRRLHLLDLTADPRLPVVVAVAMAHPGAGPPDPLLGFGCHRTTAEAASRAIGEVIQCGMWGRPPERRFEYHGYAPEVLELARAPREGLGWLLTHGRASPIEADAGDGAEDAVCAELYGEAVVVPVGQRGDEPAVVKVVVPDAPHFWARRGCPALYSLPARLGWLAETPDERDANPLYLAL